ncbi:MAG: hypothetical protein HZA51_09610 [Planctomycetes bacterium]|nr:hypothetical protein [Planctomycetota bacterium]
MRQYRDSASLIVKTLTLDQLEQLDLAIVTRDPPTYTACYKQFQLTDLGISFDVFYRYARKLRTNLRAAALAQYNVPDPDNSETLLPKLVCQRMVETLLTEKLSPRALLRLAESYRMTAQIEIQRRRLDIAEEMSIHRIATAAEPIPQLPAPQAQRAHVNPDDDSPVTTDPSTDLSPEPSP